MSDGVKAERFGRRAVEAGHRAVAADDDDGKIDRVEDADELGAPGPICGVARRADRHRSLGRDSALDRIVTALDSFEAW